MANAGLNPDELSELIASVKETLGTVFIGFSIATTLYGISCLQVYLYFKHYPKDSRFLKCLVGVFWALDTLTTALVAHSIYTWMVLNLNNIEGDTEIPWSFALENEIVDIITLFAQQYFAFQLYKLQTNRLLVALVSCFSLAAFCLDLKITVSLFADLSVSILGERSIYVLGSIVQGLCALCDIIITAGLIYYLAGYRQNGLKSTTIIIDNLILYAVTRGTLTAVCQIMFMSLNVAMPNDTFWQPFQQSASKPYHFPLCIIYVNSVLASLNFRSTEKTGAPAIPLGKRQPITTLAELSTLQTSFRMQSAENESTDSKILSSEASRPVTTMSDTTDVELGSYAKERGL